MWRDTLLVPTLRPVSFCNLHVLQKLLKLLLESLVVIDTHHLTVRMIGEELNLNFHVTLA